MSFIKVVARWLVRCNGGSLTISGISTVLPVVVHLSNMVYKWSLQDLDFGTVMCQ